MGEQALKFDSGKARYDLLPPHALDLVAKVHAMGADKYGDRNWEEGLSWGRLFGAAMRHAWAFWRHENLDPESGLPHLAHAAWNILALLEGFVLSVGEDDRSRMGGKP